MRASLSAALFLVATGFAPLALHGQGPEDLVAQWERGLADVRLTSYVGSVVSSNSTLTVLELCRGGRYRYYREGSWSLPGQAGGASSSQVTGRWRIGVVNGTISILYETDEGERGAFPIYLQNDGRVNIGGQAYRAEQGAARC